MDFIELESLRLERRFPECRLDLFATLDRLMRDAHQPSEAPPGHKSSSGSLRLRNNGRLLGVDGPRHVRQERTETSEVVHISLQPDDPVREELLAV